MVSGTSTSHSSQSTKSKMDIDVSSFNFHRAWELQAGSKEIQTYSQSDEELQKSRRARIAKYVAATAEVNYSNCKDTCLYARYTQICSDVC